MLLDSNRLRPRYVDKLTEVIFRFFGWYCLHGLTPAIDLLLLAKVATNAKRFLMRSCPLKIVLGNGDPDACEIETGA